MGLQAGGLPGLRRAVEVYGEGGVVQRSLQRERDSGDSGKKVGQVQNEEHLCLIAVIGVERPDKSHRRSGEDRERRSGDSGAWTGLRG